MSEQRETMQSFEEYCAEHLPIRIMEAGLGMRPKEDYADVPEEPERDLDVWMVGTSLWDAQKTVFLDFESALAMLAALPENMLSSEGVVELRTPPQLFPQKAYSKWQYGRVKETLAQREKALRFNKPIRKAVEEYDRAVQGLVADLYDKWVESERERMQRVRIRDTYNEYCQITNGDLSVAFTFLQKAFSEYSPDDLLEIVG